MRRRVVAIGLLCVLCFTQGITLTAHARVNDNSSLSLEANSLRHSETSLAEFVAPVQWLQQKAAGDVKLNLAPVYTAQTFSLSFHLFFTGYQSFFPDNEGRWKSHLISLLYPAHEFS